MRANQRGGGGGGQSNLHTDGGRINEGVNLICVLKESESTRGTNLICVLEEGKSTRGDQSIPRLYLCENAQSICRATYEILCFHLVDSESRCSTALCFIYLENLAVSEAFCMCIFIKPLVLHLSYIEHYRLHQSTPK